MFLSGRGRSCQEIPHLRSRLLVHLIELSREHVSAEALQCDFSMTLSRPSVPCAPPDFVKVELRHRDGADCGTFYLNGASGEFVFQGTMQGTAFQAAVESLFKQRVKLLIRSELITGTLEGKELESLHELSEYLHRNPDERFRWGDQEAFLHLDTDEDGLGPVYHVVLFHRDERLSITHINQNTGDYLHFGSLPPTALTESLGFMMDLHQVKILEQEARVVFKEIAQLDSNPGRREDRLDALKPEFASELTTFMKNGSAVRLQKGVGILKLNLMKCMVAPRLFPALMAHLKEFERPSRNDDTAELIERLKEESLTQFTPEDLHRLLSDPDAIVASISPTDLRLWGIADPRNPWRPYVKPAED